MKVLLTNRSQKSAYQRGIKARQEGQPRDPPYKGNWVSRSHMERAWLMGYDKESKQS